MSGEEESFGYLVFAERVVSAAEVVKGTRKAEVRCNMKPDLAARKTFAVAVVPVEIVSGMSVAGEDLEVGLDEAIFVKAEGLIEEESSGRRR
jgi:hypothetical protein